MAFKASSSEFSATYVFLNVLLCKNIPKLQLVGCISSKIFRVIMYSWWNEDRLRWGNVGDTNVWMWGEEEEEEIGMQPCSVKGEKFKNSRQNFFNKLPDNYLVSIWQRQYIIPKTKIKSCNKTQKCRFFDQNI